jgi:ATP:corrinoid adenosyltransferase
VRIISREIEGDDMKLKAGELPDEVRGQDRFGPGLVQVYTGNGKGKTTAALGLALRACGHRFPVTIIQFAKASCAAR